MYAFKKYFIISEIKCMFAICGILASMKHSDNSLLASWKVLGLYPGNMTTPETHKTIVDS